TCVLFRAKSVVRQRAPARATSQAEVANTSRATTRARERVVRGTPARVECIRREFKSTLREDGEIPTGRGAVAALRGGSAPPGWNCPTPPAFVTRPRWLR